MDASPLDDLLRALASSRRRAVCRYFETSGDDAADVEELVEYVVSAERPERVDDRTDHRLEVEVTLHHVHIPLLSDVGLVEYDHQHGTVTYRGDSSPGSLLDEFAHDDVLPA